MAVEKDYHVETVRYGRTHLEVRIPKHNYVGTVMPRYRPGVPDIVGEIRQALDNPIGTPRLAELAIGRKSAVVVVNDITRPTATSTFLPLLLDELADGGLKDSQITILVATGTHRDNSRQELRETLGERIVERLQVINHHCQDESLMVSLGETSDGLPVLINRLYCESDLKVVTGTIAPHHTAGFSGGRKSVLPGISGLATLKQHHGLGIRGEKPAMGRLDGNKFHESAMEAAKMAGVDFMLNTVQNDKDEITRVVAGDVETAWLDGVRSSREIYEVAIAAPVDIVITTPEGFPKDIDLYQSQKAMSAAELAVKDGGNVILLAECSDGIGASGFYEWMSAASCPEEVYARFKREGFSIGAAKAWMFSRCISRADVTVVSQHIERRALKDMFAMGASTVEEAVKRAVVKQGEDATILLMRNAADLIPTLAP